MISVLFVDDDPAILRTCKHFLEQQGDFTVDTVESAIPALDVLSLKTYDAIISEYGMPVIDGIEFLKKVRSQGKTTPFIIFTGKGREEVAIEALNSGADFYLRKGSDPASQFITLTAMIHQAVTRKKAEDNLTGCGEKYLPLAESANDMIFVTGADGVIRYANSFCAKMLDALPETIHGKTLEEIFPPDTAARLREGVRNQVLNRTPENFEVHLVTPAGSIWISIDNSPLIDKDGTIDAVLGIAQDITIKKQLEETLRLANRNLKAISSATRHDINNKLTIISGYIQLMKLEEPAPGLADYISVMERAVTDISRLLRFSKEYEKIGAEPFRWQDVHAVANIAVSEITWGRAGFSNEIKGLQIKADMLLEQVFHHLIDNAIKHGETTTSIRLRFEIRDPDVIIIVEDDGRGVPADKKERIFARSLGNNGGLGLFLCREILSATGLEIRETGEPGTGARFEIRVPSGVYRLT